MPKRHCNSACPARKNREREGETEMGGKGEKAKISQWNRKGKDMEEREGSWKKY